MNISAPTYDAAGSHAAFPSDSRIPPPPSHPGTLIPRPRTSSSPLYPAAYAIATQTRPPLPIPHTATVVAARFANNATNIRLKDRAQEWGKKGKGILEDRWKLTRRNSGGGGWAGGNPLDDHRRGQGSSSASTSADTASTASSTSSHHRGNPSVSSNFAVERASSPLGAADNPIKLPTTILGVRVPKRSGVAFGVELEIVVELTRIPVDGNYRRKNVDEVRGDDARKWLPAVAFRCFEYLDEWGRKEEGIYRVPGSSYQIAQLRALFDAGCDLDLREIHPGDLDPHAVASFFKAWLRELPGSILSPNLEAAIDILVTESTGYSAISAHFLGQRPAPAGVGMVDGRAPRELLEKLRELFGGGMPAEEYFLLRALAYHLARLASCAATNKMTLANLRLILSPTLRLSPVFLAILVEEREILFSKPNESARLREASIGLNSFQSQSSNLTARGSPTLSLSPSSSLHPSPLLNPPSPRFAPPAPLTLSSPNNHYPAPLPSPNGSSWHVLADSAPVPNSHFSLFSNTSSDPSSPTQARTPIADRFASTSPLLSSNPPSTPSSTTTLVPPHSAGASSSTSDSHSPIFSSFPPSQLPPEKTKAFIPTRGNALGAGAGFFAKRADGQAVVKAERAAEKQAQAIIKTGSILRRGAAAGRGTGRVGSGEEGEHAVLERSRKMTLQEAMQEQRLRSGSVGGTSPALGGSPAESVKEEEEEEEVEVVGGGGDRQDELELRQWSDDDDDPDEGEDVEFPADVRGGRRSDDTGGDRPSFDEIPISRPSYDLESTSSNRPSFDTASSRSGGSRSTKAKKRLSTFFGNASFARSDPGRLDMGRERERESRGVTPLPTLELPVGLGLGIAGGGEEEGDGWGLLSFDERRKFFGG